MSRGLDKDLGRKRRIQEGEKNQCNFYGRMTIFTVLANVTRFESEEPTQLVNMRL